MRLSGLGQVGYGRIGKIGYVAVEGNGNLWYWLFGWAR